MMKADKTLMTCSLEGRFPFLSSSILGFAHSLALHDIYDGKNGKTLLRDAFVDLIPESVLNRPKMGFSVPINHFLHGLRYRFENSSQAVEASGVMSDILDYDNLWRTVANFYESDVDPLRAWTICVLVDWISHNLLD